MHIGRIVTAIALSLWLALPLGSAATTLVAQDRSIAATAMIVPSFGPPLVEDSQSAAAPDFGPFTESVQAAASSAAVATSNAQQSSSITALVASGGLAANGTGSASAFAENLFLEPALASATGTSFFELTFLIHSSLAFDLSVSLLGSPSGTGSSSAYVQLLDAEEVVVAGLSRSSAFDEGADFSGVLAPGTYTLRARSQIWASADQYFPDGGSASASFEFGFSIVPEPTPLSLLLPGLAVLVAWRRGTCAGRSSRNGPRR